MTNYLVQTGTLIEDFETLTGWTTSSGTVVLDQTFIKTGSNSFKFTTPSGSNAFTTKTVSLDLSQNNTHGFWIYIEDITKLADIIIFLSNDSGFTNYYTKTIVADTVKLFNGWNFVQIARGDWSIGAGAPSWTSTFVRFRVRINAVASQVAVAYFDSYYTNPYSRPKCVITFDDVPASAYTQGYAYMDARGLKGTFFPAGAFIDTGSYMTTTQLQTAQANGWDIANHTYNHYDLTTLANQAAMETEISLNETWLLARGFNQAYKHFAYPLGGYNDTAVAALQAQGMLTARTTLSGTKMYQTQAKGLTNPHRIRIGGVINTTTLATAKTKVDEAIQLGGTVVFVFHDLVAATADTSVKWLIADFQALIDYIVARLNLIDVVTVSEWYGGLSQNNPRQKIN